MAYKINGRVVVRPPDGFINILTTKKHNGMAYRYVVNAVSKIGRPLNKGEVVHHIDGDSSNDDPDNLMVFRTKSDHSKYHMSSLNNDILISHSDGTFSVEVSFCGSDANYTCSYCGSEFSAKKYNHKHSKHVFCSAECLSKHKRRNIPDKDTLVGLLRQYRLCDISKKYKVSYNTAKKWCIGYGIDYKYSGS